MATPRKITRAFAVLLMRDIEAGIRAAVAAGHPPPPVELKYVDGLSRAGAIALTRWAAGIPEIAKAAANRSHPQYDLIAAMRDVVNHFAVDHPARPDGSPEPWHEPISEPLLSFALGYRSSIDASELSPGEARTLIDYAVTRDDLAAARLDKAHPQHQAVSAEISALFERAAQHAAAPAPSSPANGSGNNPEAGMTQDEAQTRADELGRALHSRTLSAIVKNKIIGELGDLYGAFPQVKPFTTAGMRRDEIEAMRADPVRYMPHLTGNEEAIRLTEGLLDGHFRGSARYAARDQLAAALEAGSRPQPARTIAPARTGPIPPAQLRGMLAGLTGVARAAKLTELFGPPDAAPAGGNGASADAGGAPAAPAAPGAEAA